VRTIATAAAAALEVARFGEGQELVGELAELLDVLDRGRQGLAVLILRAPAAERQLELPAERRER